MRRSEREIVDPIEINKILESGSFCNLALFDEGYPYIVPLSYGMDAGCLFFHCAKEGKKLDLIAKNNRVSFSVCSDVESVIGKSACKSTMIYRSVIGRGFAVVVDDMDEKKRGLRAVVSHYSEEERRAEGADYPDGAVNRVVVVRIDIEHMTAKASTH